MNDHEFPTRVEMDPLPLGPLRLDRRKAMKAAIGGAAAGAAFVAPRVSGFSVVPDYASAASCVGNQNTSVVHTSQEKCGNIYCWGNFDSGSFPCINCRCNGFGPLNASASTFGMTINGNGGAGGVYCGRNGTFSITVNGIDPPFQQCTVAINGNCPGSFGNFVGMNDYVLNGTATINTGANIGCNGASAGGNKPQATINLTCVCNNNSNA